MVTQLQGPRTPWDLIGQQIGANISQNLPGAVEKGYQRQQGFNALAQAQEDIAQAQGDPYKIALALAKGAIASPEASKALGPLYQAALTQGQRSRLPTAGGVPTPGGAVPPPVGTEERQAKPAAGEEYQIPGMGEAQKEPMAEKAKVSAAPQAKPIKATEFVTPRSTSITNQEGVKQFQLPYGPNEFAQARNAARQNGLLPETEDRIISDMQEYNKAARDMYEVDVLNYQQQEKQRADVLQNQSEFLDYVKNHAPELYANIDDRALATRFADEIINNPEGKKYSYGDVLRSVRQKMRPIQAKFKVLQKALDRPIFGHTEAQNNVIRDSVQSLIDLGLTDRLQQSVALGGKGELEYANLVNPLPNDLYKSYQKLPKIKEPLSFVSSLDPESPEYNEQLQKGFKYKENAINKLKEFVSNSLTSGTFDRPGTNLLITRKMLENLNLDWQDAANVIRGAVEQSGIQLDPQQEIDFLKLAYPPLTADQYFDTVMNNLLFPITGRE